MAEDELIDQVDENNQVIGPVVRAEAHTKGLWHRSVHGWVHSEQGNILIQRRSYDKSDAPGKLDMAFAGHVRAGVSMQQSVVEEAKEELDLNPNEEQTSDFREAKFDRHSEQMPEPHRQFVNAYFIKIAEDTALKFSDGEVVEVRWVEFDQFMQLLDTDSEFYCDFAYHSQEYLELVVRELKRRISR